MVSELIEPILAGLTVSIINRFIIPHLDVWYFCRTVEVTHYEDDLASSNTTISDTSFGDMHIHMH
jgi:hypothetical protein